MNTALSGWINDRSNSRSDQHSKHKHTHTHQMESGQRNNHATFAFYFQMKLELEREKNNEMVKLELSVRRVFIRKCWHFCWSRMAMDGKIHGWLLWFNGNVMLDGLAWACCLLFLLEIGIHFRGRSNRERNVGFSIYLIKLVFYYAISSVRV